MALCEAKGEPDEVRGQQSRTFSRPLLNQIRLLNARTAPLNQDDQHDDKKHSGDDPDNRGLIHFDSLPSLNGCEMLSNLVSEKRFERIRHYQHSGAKHDQKQ